MERRTVDWPSERVMPGAVFTSLVSILRFGVALGTPVDMAATRVCLIEQRIGLVSALEDVMQVRAKNGCICVRSQEIDTMEWEQELACAILYTLFCRAIRIATHAES